MLTIFLVLCALIWLPIVFHQMAHRGFLVLLVWLLIAPVATNVVKGKTNPLFESYSEKTESNSTFTGKKWRRIRQDIRVEEALEPTRVLFSLFLVVLVVGALLRKKSVLSLDRAEMCMAVFSLILVGNIVMQSERLPYSLRNAVDGFTVPFFAYYLARRLVITEDGFFKVTRILSYLGIYLIIIGLIERVAYPGLIHRLHGPFGSGTAYYYVLIVPFFAVLLSAVRGRGIPEEKGCIHPGVQWFVLCMTPVIVLLTWSRGNWVGFLMGAWVFLFLGYRLINRSRKMGLTGVLLLLVPVMVLAFQVFVPAELIEGRILATHNIEWRFARWTVAIEEGTRHPIFGIGFKNLQDVLGSQLGSAYGVHNFFLSTFVELGLVGLVSYLAIMASLIVTGLSLYKKGKNSQDWWRGVAMIAVMIAHLIPALFADTISAAGLMLVYIYVFVGGIAGLYSQPRPMPVPEYRFVGPIARIPLR